jgi:hypothetical protein
MLPSSCMEEVRTVAAGAHADSHCSWTPYPRSRRCHGNPCPLVSRWDPSQTESGCGAGGGEQVKLLPGAVLQVCGVLEHETYKRLPSTIMRAQSRGPLNSPTSVAFLIQARSDMVARVLLLSRQSAPRPVRQAAAALTKLQAAADPANGGVQGLRLVTR